MRSGLLVGARGAPGGGVPSASLDAEDADVTLFVTLCPVSLVAVPLWRCMPGVLYVPAHVWLALDNGVAEPGPGREWGRQEVTGLIKPACAR